MGKRFTEVLPFSPSTGASIEETFGKWIEGGGTLQSWMQNCADISGNNGYRIGRSSGFIGGTIVGLDSALVVAYGTIVISEYGPKMKAAAVRKWKEFRGKSKKA